METGGEWRFEGYSGVIHVETGKWHYEGYSKVIGVETGKWHFEGYSGVIGVETEATGTLSVVCLT